MWWILIAFCIRKMDWTWAGTHPELGASVWCHLVSSLSVASGALAHNVIWTDEEKNSFLQNPPDLVMQIMANIYMPRAYTGTALVRKLCDEHNLHIRGR
jgi:hypothetical protein